MNYLQIAEMPNQAELTGILRWCYDLQPSVSAEQARGVLETMRFVKRLNIINYYPEEVKLMTIKFNQGLLQAASAEKHNHQVGLSCGLVFGWTWLVFV